MKSYKLEVILSEKGVGVTEEATSGISITETRLIISVLEEYKRKLVDYIVFNESLAEIESKKKTKQ